jgi:Prenyltransferase and squalene oxidase repeat
MIGATTDLLLNAQNEDGGWGYVKGNRSNTEATSFALMALKSLDAKPFDRQATRGLKWLLRYQRDDGSWSLNDEASKQSSWTTPIAVLALLAFQDQTQRTSTAVKWILAQEGMKPGWFASLLFRLSLVPRTVELDPYLNGWSWTPGAFSWVEPTSYCLMALKKSRPLLGGTNVEVRIQQGEALLYDRMCERGGWNYGNSKVLGEALWPYPDVTAVALIALQDRAPNEANRRSLVALQDMMREAASGITLGWGILCLKIYGGDARRWEKVLLANFQKTRFLGETKALALAVLAFGEGASLFRV